MHFDFCSLSWNCYCSISGTRRFLHYNMCLLRWEKWDAGTLNGSTVRMYLVTGFCCYNVYKVSFHQVATDTSEIIYSCRWNVTVLFISFSLFGPRVWTDIVFWVFSSFSYPQILLIWGNFVAFYMINLILRAIPSLQLYTIMFRLCSQPSYWISMAVSPTIV